MELWKSVNTEEDIEILMDEYYCFHDACIVSVSYKSGTNVDNEGTMHFNNANAHQMTVLFQSQMAKKSLELNFIGLRQAHLVGWQHNIANYISDAYLKFVDSLLPGKPERSIVWASNDWFDPKKNNGSVHEPADSYIVANELKWRFV